jgi:hypothetical protein
MKLRLPQLLRSFAMTPFALVIASPPFAGRQSRIFFLSCRLLLFIVIASIAKQSHAQNKKV